MNHTIQPFSALDWVPNLIALLTFIGVVTFVSIYATRSNWRLTGPGRALMYWAVAFGLLVLMNTIHLWTGRYPGIEFVRIAVFSALCAAVWRLVFTLIRILREGTTITLQTFIDQEGNPMSKHALDVPDIVHKGQRVLRTIVQVGIPSFLAFALVLPKIIEALGLPVDSKLYVWLIGVAGAVTAVAGGIARIMAIPAVNAWLTRIGLGSVPKSELEK